MASSEQEPAPTEEHQPVTLEEQPPPTTPEQPPSPSDAYSIGGDLFATTSPIPSESSGSLISPRSFSPGSFKIYCGAVCVAMTGGKVMLIHDSMNESYYLPKREMIPSLSPETAAFRRAKAASGYEFRALVMENPDGRWLQFRSPIGAGMSLSDDGVLVVNLYYMAATDQVSVAAAQATSPYQTLEWFHPMEAGRLCQRDDQQQAVWKAAQFIFLHHPYVSRTTLTDAVQEQLQTPP